MQTTSASMAWLFLQENVQVQYLQKIALRAKNPIGPKWSHYLDMLYFPHVVRFSVAIEATIFRIERRAIEAQRLQSIFTFLSIFLYRSYKLYGFNGFLLLCRADNLFNPLNP